MDIADPFAGQLHVKDEIGLRCQKLFQDFLEEFSEDGELKYLQQIVELTSPDRSTLEVNFDDVERYNQNLATTIIEEYYRIYPYLCQVVSNVTKDRTDLKVRKDCFVSFTDVPTRHKVRDLTTAKIGTLIRISGQVVRTHAIHPELMFGTFSCGSCQTEIRDVEQQFKYTQPVICRNPVCSNRKQFILNVDKSRFVDFQRVRIQETQAELQRGCIPRSVDVVLRAEAVETVQAGDRCDFTGTVIVLPDIAVLQYPGAKIDIGASRRHGDNAAIEGIRGLKALGVRDLNYRMAFLACNVEATTSRFGGTDLPISEITAEDIKKQMSEQEWNKVYEMSRDRNLYTNLINSLFPSIYGCDELKRGVLLQLFSGVAKTTYEQTSLRGDINVCIVGDPSTAKSQLLKQVTEFTPRAIYTSGKASSAAGLTAAVVRDEETGDFVIEAGALMLADNGICCIDEFDKMDERDQVAIHEAMEQQTITIAKAGVRATLNARTSVLAAANPINGRYDRKKSLQQNIHLSAPIMSRFDLFFVLVDECNEVVDYAIARKIVDLHSNIENSVEQMYTREEVLRYITFAKQFKPMISDEAMELLVQNYTNLRQRDSLIGGKGTWRITVRQLESMVRLSEAMAKMECCNDVQVKHVNEAYRLLNKSIIRIEQPDIHFDDDDDGDGAGMADIGLMDIDNGRQRGTTTGNETDDDVQSTLETNDTENTNLQKKKLTLSFEEYKNLSNMLILRLRRSEDQIGGGGSGSDAMIIDQDSESTVPDVSQEQTTGADGADGAAGGMKRSDLINWYLEEVSDQIDSEAELIEYKTLVEKIIDRLIYHDQVILILRSSELKTSKSKRSIIIGTDDSGSTSAAVDSGSTGDDDTDDDPILVVHPSYSLE